MKDYKKKSIEKSAYKANIKKLIKYSKKDEETCDYILKTYYDVITLEQKLKLYKFASRHGRNSILKEIHEVADGMTNIEFLYDFLGFEILESNRACMINVELIHSIIFKTKLFDEIFNLITTYKNASKHFNELLNNDKSYVISLIDYLIKNNKESFTSELTLEKLETMVLESRDDKLISTYAQYHDVYNKTRVETKLINIGDPKTLFLYMQSKRCSENFDRKKAINKIIEKDNLEYILKTYVYLEHSMFDNMDIETFFQGVMSLNLHHSEKEYLVQRAFNLFGSKQKNKYEDSMKEEAKENVCKLLNKQNTCNN